MPLYRLFSGCCSYFIHIIYILSQPTLVGGRLSSLDFFEGELVLCSWIILTLPVVFVSQVPLVPLTDENSRLSILSKLTPFVYSTKKAGNKIFWVDEWVSTKFLISWQAEVCQISKFQPENVESLLFCQNCNFCHFSQTTLRRPRQAQ